MARPNRQCSCSISSMSPLRRVLFLWSKACISDISVDAASNLPLVCTCHYAVSSCTLTRSPRMPAALVLLLVLLLRSHCCFLALHGMHDVTFPGVIGVHSSLVPSHCTHGGMMGMATCAGSTNNTGVLNFFLGGSLPSGYSSGSLLVGTVSADFILRFFVFAGDCLGIGSSITMLESAGSCTGDL